MAKLGSLKPMVAASQRGVCDLEPGGQLAAERMMFTDYYAEASCTAGPASFITGEIPLRTGLTTVGQACADVGMPEKAATIAAALETEGYAMGQFGKNHLGDLQVPADRPWLR